jgi:hypothetical protein
MKKDLGKYVHVNTPELIHQIFNNPGTSIMRIPFNTVLKLLYGVAQRATELHDPQLDILMLRLNLYEAKPDDIPSLIDECEKRIKSPSCETLDCPYAKVEDEPKHESKASRIKKLTDAMELIKQAYSLDMQQTLSVMGNLYDYVLENYPKEAKLVGEEK